MRSEVTPLLCLMLLSSCDSDLSTRDPIIDDTAAPDPSQVQLTGACPLPTDQGGFTVRDADSSSGVDGSVADGVVPVSVLEEIAAEGDCRLQRRNNPFCDPACEAGETCDFNGTCLPYPSNQDLGTVTITGLAQAVEMQPVFPGNTYFNTSLPTPPFDSGALITLKMPAGVYGPATLYGVGVEPLVPIDEEWSVEAGVDLLVHWQAPAGEINRSLVQLSLNIDQHGSTPGTLLCDFEDDGEGTVPASLLQTLIQAGVTGFPNGALERHTQDHTDIGTGCMDFTVSSTVTVSVDVVGYTSCISDADCPDGMDCNEEMQVCE